MQAVFQNGDERGFHGPRDVPRFVAEAARTSNSVELYDGARAAGPLATFEAADTWVDHPYQGGVALVGDAAASTDPTYGQGLALTMHDARLLRDELLRQDDWNLAGHAYAAAHDRSYAAVHRVSSWFTELLFASGAEAEARRERALPQLAQDPTRAPDHHFSGPALPADETTRRRFFAED